MIYYCPILTAGTKRRKETIGYWILVPDVVTLIPDTRDKPRLAALAPDIESLVIGHWSLVIESYVVWRFLIGLPFYIRLKPVRFLCCFYSST
jgi:hypothetical protein